MTNILHITTSIRGNESVSNQIGNALVSSLGAQGSAVTLRDLSANDIPYVSAERFTANGTPPADRTPEQAELAAIADTLIEELQAADTIVISSPVYNFGVPAVLKAWADLVARAGTTFKYTENGPVGLLEGKKVYVTVATGGTPIGSEIDFMSSWLTHFLGFIGLTDVEVIAADGMMSADGPAKIEAALEKASNISVAA